MKVVAGSHKLRNVSFAVTMNPTPFDHRILETVEEFFCTVKFMAAVSKPYPAGVRYLQSAHFEVSPWQQQELDELKQLQSELGMVP